MKSGSLCTYYRDEVENVKDNSSDGKSLNYLSKRQKITEKTEARPA